MTFGTPSIPPRTAFWLLALVVVLGGGAAVIQSFEPQLAAQRETRYGIESAIASDRRSLARADAYLTSQRRDAALLRGIDLDGDAATIVARFVAGLARIGATTRVGVTQLGAAQARTAASSPAPATAAPESGVEARARPATDVRFVTSKLSVTLEGRYTDLLAAIRAFATLDVLAGLDVQGFSRLRGDRRSATLEVTLYRRPAPAAVRSLHAAARPT